MLFVEVEGMLRIATGFLFRAQPSLMTMDRSSKIMDEIFASPEEEGRGRLLKILQEFLVSESSKHSTKEKGTYTLNGKRVSYKEQLQSR
jgi:cohesin loading factor subunit SCC2